MFNLKLEYQKSLKIKTLRVTKIFQPRPAHTRAGWQNFNFMSLFTHPKSIVSCRLFIFYSPRLFTKEKCFEREENVKQFMSKQSKAFFFLLTRRHLFRQCSCLPVGGCCFFTCKRNRTISQNCSSIVVGGFVGRQNKTLHERDNVMETFSSFQGF